MAKKELALVAIGNELKLWSAIDTPYSSKTFSSFLLSPPSHDENSTNEVNHIKGSDSLKEEEMEVEGEEERGEEEKEVSHLRRVETERKESEDIYVEPPSPSPSSSSSLLSPSAIHRESIVSVASCDIWPKYFAVGTTLSAVLLFEIDSKNGNAVVERQRYHPLFFSLLCFVYLFFSFFSFFLDSFPCSPSLVLGTSITKEAQ